LAIIGAIFHQNLSDAFGYVCTLLGIHHGSQGAVDWVSAKTQVKQVMDTVKNTVAEQETAPGEAENVSYESVVYKDFHPEYALTLSDEQRDDLRDFSTHWNKYKDTYVEVATPADCPAILIAALHWRECSGSFKQYLHNGDPLGRPTTHVPKGVYFTEWNPAAIDAIKRETAAKSYSGVSVDETSIEDMCSFAERYNGLGYKKRGVPSPYVFAGTTGYKAGKFVEDGRYSSSTVDNQLGVLVMLREAAGITAKASIA